MEDTRTPGRSEILDTLGADSANTRNGTWIKASLTLLGVVIVALAGWFFMSPAEIKLQYKSEAVVRQDLAVTITATGQLAPVNEVEVGSELSGTIDKVPVDFNDSVTQGQVLATLDNAELDATVIEQRAALQVAQAHVVQAKATARETQLKDSRTRNLVGQKLASQEDLDAAEAAYARAQADVAGAEAQVAQAQASLDAIKSKLAKSTIRAPINGIVLSRNVEPGQTVAASFNTPVLFSLAEDLRHMELHVDVDEADVGNLRAGQSATFTVDAWPGRTFKANVTQVRYAPRTVEGVVTYETLLAVDNEDLSLRPGMTATAEITVATLRDALLVPNAALRFTPPANTESAGSANLFTRLMPRHRPNQAPGIMRVTGQSTIWILVKGSPQPETIEAGMTDGRYTAVTHGDLKIGDLVITSASGAN